MQGTARLFGQTVGAVIMTLLFTLSSADVAPQIGLGLGAVLAFVAGLVAGLVATLRVRPMLPKKPNSLRSTVPVSNLWP